MFLLLSMRDLAAKPKSSLLLDGYNRCLPLSTPNSFSCCAVRRLSFHFAVVSVLRRAINKRGEDLSALHILTTRNMIAIAYSCPSIITAVNFAPCKFTESPCVFFICCSPLLCFFTARGVLISWVCLSCLNHWKQALAGLLIFPECRAELCKG